MSSERYRPNVLVAEYVYRHEAEFAAGFLTDAGIPHRLQADDAGGADMGATMGRPARIWVRAEDAPEARELLEVTPEAAVSAPPDEEDEASVVGLFIRSAPESSLSLDRAITVTRAMTVTLEDVPLAANDGNISVRIGEDRILCPPTGVSKGYMKESMLAI